MIDVNLIAGYVPALVSAVAAIYIYGNLTERVKNLVDAAKVNNESTTKRFEEQAKRFEEQDNRLDRQDDKLNSHSIDLAKLQSWHEGFAAAIKTHGGDRPNDKT